MGSDALDKSKTVVLVVDDERHLCHLMRDTLEAAGYQVLVAYDGQEGLRLAQQHLPALAVLDVYMPKLDGFQLCKQLRADLATEGIPVLFVTHRLGIPAKHRRNIEWEGDDYLYKPFDGKELTLRVQDMLRPGRRPE